MKKILLITSLFFGILLMGCVAQKEILSFEDCAKTGNPVMESYPRQCRANGKVFVEEVDMQPEPIQVCENKCGDGECQEIVCMAIGCPCAETAESCPEDCE